MTTGTKSLLFGVHQFVWHPVTVYIAWIVLYKRFPTFKETVCIIIHDWGYWGKVNMDDKEGETHPELGAKIARALFGWQYFKLCLHHSRHYVRASGQQPSLLCWADKYSIVFDPWWLYLPRAWMSGELQEYRKMAEKCGLVKPGASHRAWHRWCTDRFKILAKTKCPDVVSYANREKEYR